ncbi:ATP-binding Cassette (ABC) Superfamily [Phytophthora infestans T30-4]|uniref:ATP-binding Cassette (ABC) Superfamily n=1 Tax=Phytophthora infestans (strain T30-4) TaxID=403677 RepID=D0NNB8_PHYIT|nr:ATP-binding Cassette (ABC) Superfamily [Phytophthora infestans T30-4]EEY62025.1 ATP-binding Cassette (ABC) Superfamily [Phytophthora infestans T30-4]|eukprot:XP_002899665.1 ATP-binding Cassette (ABC) Superfamily [Phytophthora infestans T30-4]
MARSKQEERKPLLQGVTVVHDGAASGKHTATWMPVDTPGLGDRYPSQQSGCLGNVFFSWVTPLMKLGNERPLESDDLFQLDPHNRAANVSKKFADAWEQQTRSGKPSLEWALSKAFGFKFIVAGFLKLIHDSLQFVGPMVIKDIIAYLSDPTAPLSEGLTYAAVIFAAGVVQSFALRQYFFYCYETGLQLRSAIVTAVFETSLLLSAAARQQRTSGEITNLMSIDAQRLQDMTPYLHAVWYAAFQIVVSCVLLWQQIGVATFAGVAVILLVIPLMTLISKVMRKLQQRLMQVKDERIKICVEVLSGIKVVKLKAWENSFGQRVMKFRDEELARLRTYVFARSGSNTIFSFVPSLVTVVSFSAYVLLGHTLDVGTALTSLALFNILRFPLFMLPQVLNNVVEASVSFDRLRSYFLAKERTKVGEGDLTEVGISVRGADFKWDAAPPADKEKINEKKEEEEEALVTPVAEGPTLRHVDFSAKNGELHAIVGHVGSGKSTLLAGILGDARCSAGSVAIRGKVAYVSQQPFIQNATVRDNITFGLPFDAEKYEEALRGINLSGGQRTRVAIARAVYQDADIYLLDDILSAVDSHVGADIFNECIKKTLKDKLVVLVTHSLSFVSQCDQIAVIADGRIAEHGSYKKLMATKNLLAQMVSNYVESEQEEDEENSTSAESVEDAMDDCGDEEELAITGRRKSSESRMHRRSRVSTRSDDSQAGVDDEGQLMVEEDRSVGDVSWSVYRVWINAFGGMCAAFLVVFGFFAAQGLTLLSTVWISYWSEQAEKYPDSQMYYVYVYMLINLAYAVVLFVRVMLLYVGSLHASRLLFNKLLSQILRAPTSFFDTTPLGRIVNRMSKDIYTLDEAIPGTVVGLLNTIVAVAITLVTISYITPMFMAILLPVLVGYYTSQRYFIKTSRELQRLDSISRSPIFALLSETLDGLSTIRAFGVETSFIGHNNYLLDKNQRAYFLNFTINCWLALRLEFVGTCIAAAAALSAVLAHGTNAADGTAFAGLVGVSLTYAFTVTQSLNWTVRMISQLQTQMVSVERIQTYTEMPTEAGLVSTAVEKPPLDWPMAGAISFKRVDLRYRPGLPRVLRGLTFSVNAKEKVGIVGRTGAGKSSLIVGLMRLVELDAGSITIDGVDISKIGLHDLRSNIAIIPQDPVLFSGTVRSNLDPFDQFSDDQIWTSVKRASLQKAITSLDDVVDEKGSNFSVGERQLLSIARALLKRSKVILMDEATASIDPETDRQIQQSIREEFRDCTTLTIAHRINTILDSDRILVMEKGSVAEFGSPAELQRKPDGIFKSLVDAWRQNSEDKKN